MLLKDVAVVIGMPRTGTTWLYENLKSHPDVCTSDYKEINRYLLDLTDAQYLAYFCDCAKPVKLDVSPLYYFSQEALTKIAANHEKVILLVREETAWMESLKNQFGKWDKNIDEMVKTGRFVYRLGGGKEVIFDRNSYQQDHYLGEIKRIFGNKLLVLEYSLLQRNPIQFLESIERYLGIRPYFNADTCSLERINTSEQGMSKLYALLIRMNVLHTLIPIVVRLLPKSLMHRLRKRLVYGNKTRLL